MQFAVCFDVDSGADIDVCYHSANVLRWKQSNLINELTKCFVSYLCGVVRTAYVLGIR